jgi:hypothetical protein
VGDAAAGSDAGFVNLGSLDTYTCNFRAFRAGLGEIGYVEGQNVSVEGSLRAHPGSIRRSGTTAVKFAENHCYDCGFPDTRPRSKRVRGAGEARGPWITSTSSCGSKSPPHRSSSSRRVGDQAETNRQRVDEGRGAQLSRSSDWPELTEGANDVICCGGTLLESWLWLAWQGPRVLPSSFCLCF